MTARVEYNAIAKESMATSNIVHNAIEFKSDICIRTIMAEAAC